jgi:hypothetical protein
VMDGVLLTMAQEGASIGNAVKDYVMISCPCTKGSLRWVKWRFSYQPVVKVVQTL